MCFIRETEIQISLIPRLVQKRSLIVHLDKEFHLEFGQNNEMEMRPLKKKYKRIHIEIDLQPELYGLCKRK